MISNDCRKGNVVDLTLYKMIKSYEAILASKEEK